MVPLPAGIYLQNYSCSEPGLMLSSTSCSPVIDPHLSPDGSVIAHVRDYEISVLNLLSNEATKLTFGANRNVLTHGFAEYIAQMRLESVFSKFQYKRWLEWYIGNTFPSKMVPLKRRDIYMYIYFLCNVPMPTK